MPPGKAEIIVGTDRLKPPVVYEPCTVAVVASVGAQGDMCQSSACTGLVHGSIGVRKIPLAIWGGLGVTSVFLCTQA